MVGNKTRGEEMNDWQTKIWGKTRCLIESPFYSEHELEVEEGGVCSCHFHKSRGNHFIVKSGAVRIVWGYGWKVESVVLTSGMVGTIPSLVPHPFQCFQSGIMEESYHPDRGGVVLDSDIIRLTTGCKVDTDILRDTVGIIKSDGKYWEIPD